MVSFFSYLRIIHFTILMTFFLSVGLSNTSVFKDIEEHIDSITITKENTIDEVLSKIIRNDWDETQKIRAIFYWIATNIKYDHEGNDNGYWREYDLDCEVANKTYTLRKGICSGYSNLFKLMCKKIGVEAVVIDGFSRQEISQAGLPIEYINHSWNAVMVDNNWELLDLTWAHTTAVENKCNDYYFFTKPEEFIANHYPEDNKWQLLNVPISKQEFDAYPYISGKYFEIFKTDSFPKLGLINLIEDTLKLTQIITPDYSTKIKLYSYDKEGWITPPYSNLKNLNQVEITISELGRYLIRVDFSKVEDMVFKMYSNTLVFSVFKY